MSHNTNTKGSVLWMCLPMSEGSPTNNHGGRCPEDGFTPFRQGTQLYTGKTRGRKERVPLDIRGNCVLTHQTPSPRCYLEGGQATTCPEGRLTSHVSVGEMCFDTAVR